MYPHVCLASSLSVAYKLMLKHAKSWIYMGSHAMGMTMYHFIFDINECQENSMSKKLMAEVKERLAGVDYIFMDEVSMLLYADLYKISSHLSIILNKCDVLFGGMNIIFAGDFAQLPLAIGGETASLYGPWIVCMPQTQDCKRGQWEKLYGIRSPQLLSCTRICGSCLRLQRMRSSGLHWQTCITSLPPKPILHFCTRGWQK